MGEPKPPDPGQQLRGGDNELMPFSERTQKIKDKYNALYRNHSIDEWLDIYQEITTRIEELKLRHPDWKRRTVLHAISGSGIAKEDAPLFIDDDFEGEDSVEAYLDKLTEKYKK